MGIREEAIKTNKGHNFEESLMSTLGRTISKDGNDTPAYYDHNPFTGQRRTDKGVSDQRLFTPKSPGLGYGGYRTHMKVHETIADPLSAHKVSDKFYHATNRQDRGFVGL